MPSTNMATLGSIAVLDAVPIPRMFNCTDEVIVPIRA